MIICEGLGKSERIFKGGIQAFYVILKKKTAREISNRRTGLGRVGIEYDFAPKRTYRYGNR